MEATAQRLLIHDLPAEEEGSEYTSDGTVDINKQPALKRTTGNWRACFWILGVEFSELLAFYGIAKNLVIYLTSVLHESNADAARNVSTWMGSCFFTPLIGAFLADASWGRYWTIVISLSVYTVGMLALTISTSLAPLMGSSYTIGVHRAAVYLALYLVAIGSGGIKACTSALGADQFDGADPVERVAKGSFFNWYFFAISFGSLLSGTVLVWVQNNIGWGIGFAIPTFFTAAGLAVLVAGRKVYRYKIREGSPLTTIFQVLVAAVRNHHLILTEESPALLEESLQSDAKRRIEHTGELRFFDKAAIATPSSCECESGAAPRSPWRLCTAAQMEELKMLLRMFPVWATMLVFYAVDAQKSSTLIEQGMAMDNRVGRFTVPPASLATFQVISVISGIPLYDAVLVPLAKRATGNDRGLSQLQRLGVGLGMSVVAMAYAALVEARRLAIVRARGQVAGQSLAVPMSIMWQAPAYAMLGVAEVFCGIGVLEFFYDQSPDSMKSIGTSLALLAIAAGSYLNSGALGVVVSATARDGKPGWIPDNLNEGHLDYFFWLMAALSVVNLLHFVHCSRRYRGKKTP
ncbi:hypothetical protein ACP4OV_019313 [Aristida adscensionis]